MNTHDATEMPALAELVRRGASLYTLPAVAAEVLELTELPTVDAHALKQCIERDPALTAKVLRVVNSSLFGLSRGVSDLNQAIALLGVKPLKLLVLGFSLPENLFLGIASEQLQWYWRTTLTRAVAAREVSEQLFQQSGDDAFLAGLLQDIGILALLGDLGAPYSEFIQHVIDEQGELDAIERDALGFDHRQLTAALMTQWRLPQQLAKAIGEPRLVAVLARDTDKQGRFRQAVHLADLLSQLVAQNRIKVLPDLLTAGEAYCGMDRDQLTALVASLSERVDQLAEVLAVPLDKHQDYLETMVAAHHRLATLAEESAKQTGLHGGGSAELASKTAMLQTAVATIVQEQASEQAEQSAQEHDVKDDNGPTAANDLANGAQANQDRKAGESNNRDSQTLTGEKRATAPPEQRPFEERLILAVGACRAARQPLSVAWLSVTSAVAFNPAQRAVLDQLLSALCGKIEVANADANTPQPLTRAILLPNCERHDAIGQVTQLLDRAGPALARLKAQGAIPTAQITAGVATVTLAPRNFPATALLETAHRCQTAAAKTGGVKSLEIC